MKQQQQQFFNTEYARYRFEPVLNLENDEGEKFKDNMSFYYMEYLKNQNNIFQTLTDENKNDLITTNIRIYNDNSQMKVQTWRGLAETIFRYFNVYYDSNHIASFSLALNDRNTAMYQLAINFTNYKNSLYFIFYYMICVFNKPPNKFFDQVLFPYYYYYCYNPPEHFTNIFKPTKLEDHLFKTMFFGPKELEDDGLRTNFRIVSKSSNVIFRQFVGSRKYLYYWAKFIDPDYYNKKTFASNIINTVKAKQRNQVGKIVQKFKSDSDKYPLNRNVPLDVYKDHLKYYLTLQITDNINTIQELQNALRQKNQQQIQKIKEQQRIREQQKKNNVLKVYDAYLLEDIPISEFLQEENRVLFISESGHYFGSYLQQCEVVYECDDTQTHRRAFNNYVGNPDVHAMIQFPTASGSKFYFDVSIDDDMKNGYNVFHFRTEQTDLKVLSKDVATGGTFISGIHCDPKDTIKLSTVTDKEKQEGGLRKTVNFEW